MVRLSMLICDGVGFGLVKALSARDNVIVFAGARNPAAAQDLQTLAAERAGKLHVVKLISSDAEGNAAAIAFIKDKTGRLDVVIANAGTPTHSVRSTTFF
jgi:NAD(P)-dependent dehydrogenase (short-subunit alcohol dehydrogenase family)